MSAPADTSCVFMDGPWTHRFVQANGCQFHLAHMGEHRDDLPLVVLVHGYPEYWWAWRHQLEPIAAAGYEVVAIDQRGIAGSDKTPEGADALTLSHDIGAIARSLGASRVVVVGHGRGGSLAWATPTVDPNLVEGIVTFSAPHPRTLQRVGAHLTLHTWRHVANTFIPPLARRAIKADSYVKKLLVEWSAKGNDGAASQAHLYAAAMRLPEAARYATEQLRWSYTAQQRPTGRKYFEITKKPVTVPVWSVQGSLDPLLPGRAWRKDAEFAKGNHRHIVVPGAGHFVPEEAPEESTRIILDFLRALRV
ncbi:MAG: alpha/beta hydrolase [Ancrocorticia sp.]